VARGHALLAVAHHAAGTHFLVRRAAAHPAAGAQLTSKALGWFGMVGGEDLAIDLGEKGGTCCSNFEIRRPFSQII
jgi:hypothetical protein